MAITSDLTILGRNRRAIRAEILTVWEREECGTGEHRVQYRYNVEKLADGSWVYLLRPAWLNKGCDFAVLCENFLKHKNGKDKRPSHRDVSSELLAIAQGSVGIKPRVVHALRRVWECNPPDEVILGFADLGSADLSRLERVLKIARWLFIEQDITYWTQSGREMLLRSLEKNLGPVL